MSNNEIYENVTPELEAIGLKIERLLNGLSISEMNDLLTCVKQSILDNTKVLVN